MTDLSDSEKARIIAEELQGTCNSLQFALESHEWDGADNSQDFCDTLDSLVFECKVCNWWCETSEMSHDEEHDWECEDCADA